MPQSATAGSYGKCLFNLVRNPQTTFHSGCNFCVTTGNGQVIQLLCILAGFNVTFLFRPSDGCVVLMVLILIFLTASNVEQLFICSFTFHKSSAVKYLFISFAHILTGFLVSLLSLRVPYIF